MGRKPPLRTTIAQCFRDGLIAFPVYLAAILSVGLFSKNLNHFTPGIGVLIANVALTLLLLFWERPHSPLTVIKLLVLAIVGSFIGAYSTHEDFILMTSIKSYDYMWGCAYSLGGIALAMVVFALLLRWSDTDYHRKFLNGIY
ncbi:MAG TPA: hypothetical protein VMU07_03355 [Candidatus Paceibacterota bacterium]|nr:hypothetical protein [Candidatus Paceibacterota bacterium]